MNCYWITIRLPDLTPLKLFYWHIRLWDAERSGNGPAAIHAATRIIQLGGSTVRR